MRQIFVSSFARKFPDANVYVAPGQWSFPVNLPLPLIGINPSAVLEEGENYPWSEEIEFKTLTASVGESERKRAVEK